MGKASRVKRERPAGNRTDETRRRITSRFLSQCGVVLPSNNQQLWLNVESRMGVPYADELVAAIEGRAQPRRAGRTSGSAVYDVVYRSPEAAMATVPFVTPMVRSWCTHIQSLTLPEGPLVDLGSGSGLLTCFYGVLRPESEVVGVEINPAGVQCGRWLAAKLGLSNVSFVEGDALHFTGGDFAVVTSVASMTEMGSAEVQPAQTFSLVSSAEADWQAADNQLARSAALLLGPSGAMVSMERLGNFHAYARWFSAVQRAGLRLELDQIAAVEWDVPPAGAERMPALVASRDGSAHEIGFKDFLSWYVSGPGSGDSSLLTELDLRTAGDVAFERGFHVDVRDAHGAGQTRVYLVTRDDEPVMYMTTSRGYRTYLPRSPHASSMEAAFEQVRVEMELSPQVVNCRELSAEELAADLGRGVA